MVSSTDRKRFFDLHQWRFGRCLEPTLSCMAKPIRAHSIQNARAFDLLSSRGHVTMFKMNIAKDGPQIVLRQVGRNEASTFLGFCAQHDASIFRALDAKPLNLHDAEQLFLLAYRSVCRELHATMEAASKIQSAYLNRVEKGWDDGEVPTPAGMEAVSRAYISWMTFRYRHDAFDTALLEGNFQEVVHDVFTWPGQRPAVAASCLFSLDEVMKEEDVVRAILNVVPISENETAVIFSYSKADAGRARLALDRIISAQGAQQKYELSKLLIERTENFALSPAFAHGWSVEKLAVIKQAFIDTMFESGIKDDVRLMLFA